MNGTSSFSRLLTDLSGEELAPHMYEQLTRSLSSLGVDTSAVTYSMRHCSS